MMELRYIYQHWWRNIYVKHPGNILKNELISSNLDNFPNPLLLSSVGFFKCIKIVLDFLEYSGMFRWVVESSWIPFWQNQSKQRNLCIFIERVILLSYCHEKILWTLQTNRHTKYKKEYWSVVTSKCQPCSSSREVHVWLVDCW